MTRRKIFDPSAVPPSFWRDTDVQTALARREIGRLFQLYVARFPDCTQTQLALLTEHDRSDISNWIRGARQGRVSDVEVLARIADGLLIPDDARVLLGIAPADTRITAIRAGTASLAGEIYPAPRLPADGPPDAERVPTVAICGSRAPGTDGCLIDAAVRHLARLVLTRGWQVRHGPVGVGIEVMIYIGDHYRPPGVSGVVGLFGRRNVVRDADVVVVVGGGAGTQDEVDLAVSLNRKVVALPASGGAARHVHEQAGQDRRLRDWMTDEEFDALGRCDTAEEFARIVGHLVAGLVRDDSGVPG